MNYKCLYEETKNDTTDLDDANLVSNIECVEVWGEADVCLLLAVRPDESVDLGHLNWLVHLPNGLLDLELACAGVHNEHEGVVLLDLLHGRLGGEWVLEDLVGSSLLTRGRYLRVYLG